MTYEKARDLLAMIEVKEPNELIVNSWWGSFAKDYKEALQMAIEALEQESYENVVKKDCGNCAYYDNGANDEACNGCFEDEKHLNFKPKAQYCEDCISRQAVLNGLASIAKVKARSDAQKSLMGRSMFFVEQLSPVTPKEKTRWIPVIEVLEKIKKEIKQIRIHNGYLDVQGVTIIEVLEIIDKHLSEVNNDT